MKVSNLIAKAKGATLSSAIIGTTLTGVLGVGAYFAYDYTLENNKIVVDKEIVQNETSAKTNINLNNTEIATSTEDTTKKDTSLQLRFPIKDKRPFSDDDKSPFDLDDPQNVKKEVRYNPQTGKYEVYTKIGDMWVKSSQEYTKEEYLKKTAKEEEKNYFKQRAQSNTYVSGNGSKPDLIKRPEFFDKIFGGGLVDIQPSGSAELTFGGNFNTVRNPAFSARQQKTGNFDFDQKLQVSMNGKIGDRMQLGIKYDTEATFEFENQTKLDWVGKEDDILKGIELGNVSLPLNGSLIQAGQSLFGIKTKLQFGRLTMTSIFTQNKGQRTETEVSGGAQITEFNIQADNYDANRHYFLAQFFKNQYDQALANLPVINSGVVVNRVEVWVTNRSGDYQRTRDVLPFMDLAERAPHNTGIGGIGNENLPADNGANILYNQIQADPLLRQSATCIDRLNTNYAYLQQGVDYDLLNYARQLNENEYTLNSRLGFISLTQPLNNDEILGVAFEYTYNGQVYKVGEFSSEIPADQAEANVLFVKMLKGTTIRTNLPMWDLMMKNIYNLGTFNINTEDFKLNVIYADDPSGSDLNYLPVEGFPGLSGGVPLLTVMGLDRINRQQEAKPDGVFDIIEDITINTRQGKVIFPVTQPFGKYLKSRFGNDTLTASKYVFQALYDSTKWLASMDVQHNKFFLRGSYKGSSSAEISLNSLNVPQGSVTVTANGNRLTEGVDYIIDYSAGKVTIVNQGILQSGAVIRVSSESNSLFNVQQKTLLGSRFDYKASRNLILGGTILHMYERPLTPKTNIGEEPLMNTIIGFDGTYTSKSRLLTKLVDKLPFLETKEESSITFSGEYARIFPGRAKGLNGAKGVSYLDDFEAAETPFDLKLAQNWKLASVPQKQPDLFPEWDPLATDKTAWGNFRGLTSWYILDPTFFRNDRFTPTHIKNDPDLQSNHYTREVTVKEVFPQKQLQQGVPTIIPTLDLAFYPKERGFYNFNHSPGAFNANGQFINPQNSWGGIMRKIETNDFTAANIDYIEIWILDPFIYNANNQGTMYINLGNISEDILPDRRKSFENGLPKAGGTENTSPSTFGKVPVLPQINNAFDNSPEARPFQDIGYDGLNDEEERLHWKAAFLDSLATNFGINSPIYLKALQDPANDNYTHYLAENYDQSQTNILGRYKKFNGVEGNSTLDKLPNGTPLSATINPDVEDINNDFTMNQTEDYYQYKIPLSRNDLRMGQGYVTDSSSVEVELKNGKKEFVTWYQLKIPVSTYEKAVGNISDFKSIRFLRVFLKGFDDSIVCRFAQIQLVRADWRRHLQSLKTPGVVIPLDPTDNTLFSISAVNIEENAKRNPVNYVTPPSIDRVIDPTTPGAVQQNEQSLSLSVCNLKPGDARAAFKTTNVDIRNYKNFKMFVHAEGKDIEYGDMVAFVRIGTDLTGNYYEYEVPLKITPEGETRTEGIWPAENEFNFQLDEFYLAKDERYKAGNVLNRPFYRVLPNGHRVMVLGLPDLSNVRVVMLGIRNKSDKTICGEVWFNEMRVTDFTNKGGWAANARMVAQMADFGTLTMSGNIKTIGFGGIDQKLNQRSLHDFYQYDISTNLELGKFFPVKSGITIPMFIGWTESLTRPKFNPFNPDMELQNALNLIQDPEEKNRIKNAADDASSRYSINFTNVKKNRVGNSKQMPWDIENFNFSYSYTHIRRISPQIEESFNKTRRASLGYNYANNAKPWQPFRTKIKSKKFQYIKDFNLYFFPQSINIRMDVDRYYSELLNRNNDLFRSITPRLFDKNFTMTRIYNFSYKITNSLKLDYSSTANARIEEPFGRLDSEEKRDSVRQEFFAFGQMSQFNQTTNLNYTVPLNKIKSLDWVSLSTRYGANYGWQQAPPSFPSLGHTIQNSRDISINGQLNFNSFYNKFPLLRKLNAQKRPPVKEAPKKSSDTTSKKKKEKELAPAAVTLLRFVTMFKNANFSYTDNRGTALPGFKHTIDYVGQNFAHEMPGFPFIFGSQDPNIRYKLARLGALSDDPRQSSFYIQKEQVTLNGRITMEPFKDFRIEFQFDKTYGKNTQSVFKYDTSNNYNDYRDQGLVETGNYSVSYIFWRTAFAGNNADNSSPVFSQFENNRFVIAQRLQNADERVNIKEIDPITKYPIGYSRTSQDVLIPAFFAAYTGKSTTNASLSPFPRIPLPNWRINWSGLAKNKKLAKTFTNITISHSYTGRYTIGGYTTNLFFDQGAIPVGGKDLVSKYQMSTVTISESFLPFIGIDVNTKKGWTARLEYKKRRLVSLFVNNFNVTENIQNEFVIGGGYRGKEVKLPFIKHRGRSVYLENDLNFRLDFSITDNKIFLRKIDQPLNEPTSGNLIVSIKPTLDYMINNKLNLSIFYDRRSSKPAVSQSFPTALTQFGIRLRYTIQ